MKKLLAILTSIILSFNVSISNAALNAGTAWEVRTSGSSDNGGGFVATPFTTAPSAPTVNASGNNSVSLGTYYVIVTYVDAYGETAKSNENSIVVNDANNDTIVVTSPAASINAVLYKVYIGTVSGGPYYIQNSTGTSLGTNYSRTTTPATTGDQPSGADYSQQDAAQDSGTDLACADGDATSPVITSASHNFIPVDVGNIINITETGDGFTLGRYEIVGVDGSNGAILDRACGTDGAKTGGDWFYGGCVAHPQTIAPNVVANNTIHIKIGTYVKIGANAYVINTSIAGGGRSRVIRWIGYNSSRLDAPVGVDRPILDGDSDNNGANDTTNVLLNGASNNQFENLIFKRASADNVDDSGSDRTCIFKNCRFTGATDKGFDYGSTILYLMCCEVDNNSGGGISILGAGYYCWTFISYIHDNTGYGVYVGDGSINSIKSIVESNTNDGFSSDNSEFIVDTLLHNNTGATSDGYDLANDSGARGSYFCFNSAATSNGRDGFRLTYSGLSNSTFLNFDYNGYNGNSSNGIFGIIAGSNDVTDAPSFTDSANGDFTLQSGSPYIDSGVNISSNCGVTGVYKSNIGPDQDDTVTAGGGGGGFAFFHND